MGQGLLPSWTLKQSRLVMLCVGRTLLSVVDHLVNQSSHFNTSNYGIPTLANPSRNIWKWKWLSFWYFFNCPKNEEINHSRKAHPEFTLHFVSQPKKRLKKIPSLKIVFVQAVEMVSVCSSSKSKLFRIIYKLDIDVHILYLFNCPFN